MRGLSIIYIFFEKLYKRICSKSKVALKAHAFNIVNDKNI